MQSDLILVECATVEQVLDYLRARERVEAAVYNVHPATKLIAALTAAQAGDGVERLLAIAELARALPEPLVGVGVHRWCAICHGPLGVDSNTGPIHAPDCSWFILRAALERELVQSIN